MTTATIDRPTAKEAAQTLRDSLHAELHRLVVTETESEVILSGHLPSFYLKSLAQETIRPVLGERRLRNRITVR